MVLQHKIIQMLQPLIHLWRHFPRRTSRQCKSKSVQISFLFFFFGEHTCHVVANVCGLKAAIRSVFVCLSPCPCVCVCVSHKLVIFTHPVVTSSQTVWLLMSCYHIPHCSPIQTRVHTNGQLSPPEETSKDMWLSQKLVYKVELWCEMCVVFWVFFDDDIMYKGRPLLISNSNCSSMLVFLWV